MNILATNGLNRGLPTFEERLEPKSTKEVLL